jgi:hypothetical protein
MDFDPRDYDSSDVERCGGNRERGSRGSGDERDWDDWRQPAIPPRERDEDPRELGRGPVTSRDTRIPTSTARTRGTTRDGRTASAMAANASSIRASCSPVT